MFAHCRDLRSEIIASRSVVYQINSRSGFGFTVSCPRRVQLLVLCLQGSETHKNALHSNKTYQSIVTYVMVLFDKAQRFRGIGAYA